MAITNFLMCRKLGKRLHRCECEAASLAEGLSSLFNGEVDIPRIKHGNKQTLDTLINEAALLLAKFLRNERGAWKPRRPNVLVGTEYTVSYEFWCLVKAKLRLHTESARRECPSDYR